MLSSKLILGCAFARLIFTVYGQEEVNATCLQADDVIMSHSAVQNSFSQMMQKFNKTCTDKTCVKEADHVELYLVHDYRKFSTTGMKAACERKTNYKMCKVTTKTRFNDLITIPVDELDIGTYIMEVDKPVCFPPSCKNNQANILEPNPARCNPNGSTNCEVVSYRVKCPNDRVTNGANTCKNDALNAASGFFFQRGLTEATILADCANAVQGNPSSYCSFGFGDLVGHGEAHFASFETDKTYMRHDNFCNQAGGAVCTVDFDANIKISSKELKALIEEAGEPLPLTKVGSVTVSANFTSFPQCLPKTCDGKHVEALMERHLMSYVDKAGLPVECDLTTDSCNLNIRNYTCNGKLTKDLTDAPTSDTSPFPSAVLSSSPSSDPTHSLHSTSSSPSASPSKIQDLFPGDASTIGFGSKPTSSGMPSAVAGNMWALILFTCGALALLWW